MFVKSQEISRGVFISKGIIDSCNPVIRILNIDEFKCIRNDQIIAEKLRNFYIYLLNETKIDSDRKTKLMNILKS